MHLATSCHLEFLGGVSVRHAERHVLEKLAVESVAKLTGGNKLTLLAREGAGVDRKGHLKSRLADLDELKRLGGVKACDGVTDGDRLGAGEAHDVTHLCGLHGHAHETVDLEERHDLGALGRLPRMVVANIYVLILA